MESSFFQPGPKPITATLAKATFKASAQNEKRIMLEFEVPLTPELIALAPLAVQTAATAIGNIEAGMTEGQISTEFDQTIEIYPTPDHTTPQITLSSIHIVGLTVFRPTPKEGPSTDLFLTFSTTVKAEAPFGGLLATWALENLRGTVFFRGFDVQGSLALASADEPKPKKVRAGKDAAAGE